MALALGRTVDELLDSITWEELTQWVQFDALDPIGERRGDIRMAQLCALTANINRDAKRKPEPFQLAEFMPFEKAHTTEPKRDGAHIDPALVQWLFVKARKNGK